MTLTAEEKQGLLAEAADPRRREVFARFRHRGTPLSTAGYLDFLASSACLFGPLRTVARRRPVPGGRYLL